MRAFRKHSLALAGITLGFGFAVYASTAVAASTFLLQFGEHKTEEEARNQWENLRSANPEVLSKMKFRLGEVGEGSETRFRSQASGPASRTDAQDACAKLASANVECLVVETSMYQPSNEPELKLSDVAAATDSKPAMAELPLPAKAVTETAPAGLLEPVAEFSLNDAPSVAKAPVEVPAAAAIAANTTTPTTDLSVPPAEPTVTKSKSFKETLMPWLSSEKETENQIADAKAELAEIEAKEPKAAEPVVAAPAPTAAPAQFEPVATPAPVVAAAPAPAPAAPAAESDESFLSKIGSNFDSSVKSGKQVPERAPKNLADATSGNQPVAVGTAPQIQPETPINSEVQGQVEVAEAVQVPLSFDNGVPVPSSKPVGYGGFPSQAPVGRSTWVQIGQFGNKDAAMGYWRELSYKEPETTRLLRVRIVSPWQSAATRRFFAATNTSLRMGPFASQDDVTRICTAAAQQQLSCTTVQEVGSSGSQTNGVRTRISSREQVNQSKVSRRAFGTGPSNGMYWLQLGAFSGVAEAQQRWSQMQATHQDVLGRLQSQISYPALGSSAAPVYHLRTGPFVASGAASAVCDQLKARRLGCVVVQSR